MSALATEPVTRTTVPERAPRAGRVERILPLAGVAFGVLLAIALWATSGEPSDNASVNEVFSYWREHAGGKMWLSILGLELAAVLLVSFGAALQSALRARARSVYPSLVLAGATLAAMGFATTTILEAGAARAAAEKGEEPGIRTAVYAIEQLRSWDWLMWTPGLTVMLVAAGLGGLRTKAFPKALSLAAIVLGVAFFTPAGFFAFFVLPAWMAAAGIALYRTQPSSKSAADV